MAHKFSTYNLGVVVNRVKGEHNEHTIADIEAFLDSPILGVVPEDRSVRDAIAMKEPVVASHPRSKAALQMKAIAAKLIGEEFSTKPTFSERLFGWLR